MHAGKGLYTSCAGKHGGRYKTYFTSLKPVLAFQTLMLAMLGKWATTHERVFFLGKNCSWTLLPGAIWLQTPITRLRYISCLQSFRTHFDFVNRVDDLWVLSRRYDASQPPGRHTRYFKAILKVLVDIALMQHISFLFDGISFDARSIHVLCFTSQ